MKNKKPFIVLIEDNPNTRRFIKEAFEKRGVKIMDFASGEAFLEKGASLTPDIFIIDYILSTKNDNAFKGTDIVDRIKRNPLLKHIPIIMLSTLTETMEILDNPYYQSKIEGIKVGAWDVIHKPHGIELLYKPDLFPFDELYNKVRILLYNKQIQDELRLKNLELETQNQRLTAIMHFITHEIKNKLVVIEGLSRSVLSGNKSQLPEKESKFVKQIFFDATDIRRLIESYLLMFQRESGLSQIHLQQVGVRETVAPILDRLEMYLESNKMELKRRGFDSIAKDARINADPFLLSIVFENLFNNAVKYGKKGKIIVCGVEERRKTFRFDVWNAGKGIPPEELDQVFEQFYRTDESINIKGTGIGLATVKEIVKQHGGKIWAESDYGNWVNFIFTIPKATDSPN